MTMTTLPKIDTIRSRVAAAAASGGPSSPTGLSTASTSTTTFTGPSLSALAPSPLVNISNASSSSSSSISPPSQCSSTSSSSSVDLPASSHLGSPLLFSTHYHSGVVRPPVWAWAAQRAMQFVWLLAVMGRWALEAQLMWFTTWAFAVHTIFQMVYTAALFDLRFLPVARYLWFPVHSMAWMVFLGVNLVFATNTTGLRIPTPESATLAHHFLHIGPLLYMLATCPSAASGLVFSHPNSRVRMGLLAFPMAFALVYRCIYRPDEVYVTNYGDALWIFTAFVGVVVAYMVEAISYLHVSPAMGNVVSPGNNPVMSNSIRGGFFFAPSPRPEAL